MAKLIVQQCIYAKLQTNFDQTNENERNIEEKKVYVEINRGVVAYVCFLKSASIKTVEKLCNLIYSIKLSKPQDNGKLVSLFDLKGDLLLVPQATLGGKLRGKSMQYHNNISKQEGHTLFELLVNLCREKKNKVEHGTYGNLQVLNIETNGPYTHSIEVTDV